MGGGYVDRNGTSWNVYKSFADATDEFGSLISKSYFSIGKISVETVGTIYCDPPTDWAKSVKSLLEKMYSAVGETITPARGSASGDTIVKKAADMMQMMIDEKWTYSQGNYVPMNTNLSKKGKYVDCSSFVCWVLYELGWTNCQSSGWQLSTATLPTWFNQNGWKTVTSENDLQPGDILLYSGHTEIFAYKKNGVNYVVNAGFHPYEHSSAYTPMSEAFSIAYRTP